MTGLQVLLLCLAVRNAANRSRVAPSSGGGTIKPTALIENSSSINPVLGEQ